MGKSNNASNTHSVIRSPYNWYSRNKSTFNYITTNLAAKAIAAVSQIYAIIVFTDMHPIDHAASVFLLLGYTIWFQLAELGLSQSLQNQFNLRKINSNGIISVVVIHLILVFSLALLIILAPELTSFLLPSNDSFDPQTITSVFSVGAAILIIASNNRIIQRLLLLLNKGVLSNILILFQSLFSIFSLALYHYIGQSDLLIAVFLYLGPQVIFFIPILIRFLLRLLSRTHTFYKQNWGEFIYDSIFYCGLALLSTCYLGLDYFFAARYLSNEDIIIFHVTSRLFFISFIFYFSFVQYRAKKISSFILESSVSTISTVFYESVLVGLFAVFFVFIVGLILVEVGWLSAWTNGINFDPVVLSWALCYYTIRVGRDTLTVILSNLGSRQILSGAYGLELLVCLTLAPTMAKNYAASGIFCVMAVSSFASLILMLWLQNKSLSKKSPEAKSKERA